MLPGAVDVLVLGAGLAGLRAALSCRETAPDATVLVASLGAGPSGSSFANRNDALGIHACLTDRDREDYVREALALNTFAESDQTPAAGQTPQAQGLPSSGPGNRRDHPDLNGRKLWLSSELLAIQAEEGEARLKDLVSLGLPFVRDDSGRLTAHSSCFSPHSRRAYVFTGLSAAHGCFRKRLAELGCSFASGWEPASIVLAQDKPGGKPVAAGTVLVPASGGEPVMVTAKAVVVALGGPGRLFAHSVAGPGVPGYGQGLLTRAGADMANLGYLQYMWGTLPGKAFWQPAALGSGGYLLASPDGGEIPIERLVPNLAAVASSRAGHCPYGYGLVDSALDLALADALDAQGGVTLRAPDGRALRVAPMAHASNGGAVIDANAETSVPGLLACGECATGMHGANRIGGGMVLATQVFGHRAGVRAARIAAGSGLDLAATPPQRAGLVRPGVLASDESEREWGKGWLARELSRCAVLGGRPGCLEFAAEVRQRLAETRDWRLSLSLETGLGILAGLPVDFGAL